MPMKQNKANQTIATSRQNARLTVSSYCGRTHICPILANRQSVPKTAEPCVFKFAIYGRAAL